MNKARIVEPRYDTAGKLIVLHDVLRDEETGEMAIVISAKNKSGVMGLAVENTVIGLGDWLDVYPDGVWTVVGNLGVSSQE